MCSYSPTDLKNFPRRIPTLRSARTLERERAETFGRLLTLLEARPEGRGVCRPAAPGQDTDALSRLARLRAARACYVLSTGAMERMGAGVWFNRRAR